MSDQNQWPKPGESSGGADGRPQHDGQSDGQQSGAPQSSGQQSGTPYGQPSQGSPYGQGQQSSGNPYAQQSQHNPYAQQQSQQHNPYGQQSQQHNPYAASGPQHNPYAPQQGSNPYASPYATAGYQPYAQRPKTNTLAILSIVFAYAGIIIWPVVILTSPAGAIMGHIALGKIKQTGESGRGLALAGIIGGWVLTGLYVLFAILFIVLIANSGGGYSDPYDYDPGAFVR